jgi:hypothetical protein
MNFLIIDAARTLLRKSSLLPSPIQSALKSFVARSENAFVLHRATTWNLDAPGRLEWIDGMGDMIRTAKKSYNENIR